MSAAPVFLFRTDVPCITIQEHVRTLWSDYFVDVTQDETDGPTEVEFGNFMRQGNHAAETLNIIRYLLSISTDGVIHYIRDRDGYSWHLPPNDYPCPLSPEDVLQPHFEPGMYNGIQFRCVIQERLPNNTVRPDK